MSSTGRDPFLEGLAGMKDAGRDPKAFGAAMRLMRDALFGGRRDKTKAIAEHFGVSPRQARRLMAGDVKTVKADRAEKIRDEFSSDQRLRRVAVDAGGKPARPGKQMRLTVTGNGGPIIGDSDHSKRPRPPIDLTLTPSQYERLRTAFADHGATGALDEINQHGDQYFDSFQWSKVSHIEVR
ncbi:hypothetical protein [Krasilnikovia sp. MM14-A1259]|uniref:hypothetical protein n=1 Tax=Krasilnikovia sp. MM14-A1259 TaxID=3373539 RepID=UPI00381447E8